MKTKTYKKISDVYDYIEKNALNYKYSHSISDLFKEVRDYQYKRKKEKASLVAQWEMDFFNFNINDGKLSFLFSGVNNDGSDYEYPSLKNFTNETYEYLQKRNNSTSNSFLKSRYSHLLWFSPKKHIDRLSENGKMRSLTAYKILIIKEL